MWKRLAIIAGAKRTNNGGEQKCRRAYFDRHKRE